MALIGMLSHNFPVYDIIYLLVLHVHTQDLTVYMGRATTLKKPVWLLVTPPFVRSMSGETGCPRALSRSP